jgi:hypothetical protein
LKLEPGKVILDTGGNDPLKFNKNVPFLLVIPKFSYVPFLFYNFTFFRTISKRSVPETALLKYNVLPSSFNSDNVISHALYTQA